MFNEALFLERIDLAANAGFSAVECLFPYAERAEVFASRLKLAGLRQVLFNGPPGDWEKGERGFGALPGRQEDFRKSIGLALLYAEALQCPRIHVMAGVPPAGSDLAQCRAAFVDNLQWASEAAEKLAVTLLLEPLNPIDMPGYFLNSVPQATGIISSVGRKNVAYQFDAYHVQMSQGRIAETFTAMLPLIGHIQVSGVPGRCEPDENQEINFPYLFTLIEQSTYDGWVGCEYRPRNGTENGLGWFSKWQSVQSRRQ